MREKLSLAGIILGVLVLVAAITLGVMQEMTVRAAAAELTPADVSQTTPFVPTLTAAVADGFTFANNGRSLIWIENGTVTTTVYLTVTTPATFHGFSVADLYFTVAPKNRKVAGPFSTVLFNDSEGDVGIALNTSTSISATVVRY